MRIDETRVSQLRELGLNAYEARAYLTLLGKQSFSATQVADYSSVPRQRIYDVLASLVERGMVVSKPGRRGTRYTATAPQQALESLLQAEQQRLARIEEATESLIGELSSLYSAGQEETSPLEYIEVLRGGAAINQRFAEIQANSKREILVFTKPPYARPPQENLEGMEILQRRVRACSVYEYSALDDAEVRQGIASFIRLGEDARFVEQLPLKLVIVDEAIVLFAMEDPLAGRTELTIMVIENPGLAQTLKLAFDTVWSRGDTFEQACERLGLPAEETSPQEQPQPS